MRFFNNKLAGITSFFFFLWGEGGWGWWGGDKVDYFNLSHVIKKETIRP